MSDLLTSPAPDPVAEPSLAYKRMAARWPKIRALLGGTQAMRAAGEKFLPKFSGEEVDAYRARLAASFLYPALKDTIDKLVAKPFGKPLQVENAPTALEHLQWNADLKGNSLGQFGADAFRQGLSYGITYILVDMPRNPERRVNAKPYFSHYRAQDVLGGKFGRDPNTGEIEITQIRLQEWNVEDAGDYGEELVSVIIVWNGPQRNDVGGVIQKGTIEVWKKRDEEEVHTLVDLYEHDFDGIPIAVFDPGEIDFLEAAPPLEDLAWLNLEHWQSSSDQRAILHYARAYTVFIAGMTPDEQEKIKSFGVSQIWFAENPEAEANVVEHTGASITAGESDIKRIEERMESLGAQVFVQRSGNQTATGKAIDDGKGQSQAQHWVASLEATLEVCYGYAAEWMGEELPDDFKIEIFKDFGMTMRRAEDLQYLDKARMRQDLSLATFLREMKKRGLLGDDVDVEAEIAAIESDMDRYVIAPENAPEPNPAEV